MADQPPVIKKIKKVEGHGHHGGAWKVAYADFVTAMMAFFLLLWLLNVTTKEQKEGIAEYFNPTMAVTSGSSGPGILGGEVPAEEDSTAINLPLPNLQRDPMEMRKRQEEEAELFRQAEHDLRQAIQDIPELAQLAENLIIDQTPEGLRIQLVDQEKKAMFPSGSATMYDYTEKLVALVSKVIKAMPNHISVGGHTDATPYRSNSRNYTNWELSADRANALRRSLLNAGIPRGRIARVSGYAAQQLLDEEHPTAPRNRRISILLLREAPFEVAGENDMPGAAAAEATPPPAEQPAEHP